MTQHNINLPSPITSRRLASDPWAEAIGRILSAFDQEDSLLEDLAHQIETSGRISMSATD